MNVKIHTCSENEFRLSCKKSSDVDEMLKILTEETHITWRVLRTDPIHKSSGIKQVFYVEYRCQSSNFRILHGAQNPSRKHTDCKAHLTISIKRVGHRCRYDYN